VRAVGLLGPGAFAGACAILDTLRRPLRLVALSRASDFLEVSAACRWPARKNATMARLVAGNMRVGTFNNAKDDEGNELADNVAGYLTERLHNEVNGAFASCGDKIVWEIWEPESRE
jgi:hypothetical protein